MFNTFVLLFMAGITIIVGYFLKERLNESVKKFEKGFKESGLSE